MGLLDDVLDKYPIDKSPRQDFDRRLLMSACLGGPQIINEGYLLNSPAGRKALVDPNSLLRVLAQYGHVKLLRRRDSLADVPEAMQAHVPSFAKLVNSTDWSELKPKIGEAERALEGYDAIRPWPEHDISEAFHAFMASLAQRESEHPSFLRVAVPGQLRAVLDAFLHHHQTHPRQGTRSTWEHFVDVQVTLWPTENRDRTGEVAELMHLACEAYHMAFTACLMARRDAGEVLLGVETRFSPAFAGLAGAPGEIRPEHAFDPQHPPPAKTLTLPDYVDQVKDDAGWHFIQQVVVAGNDLADRKGAFLSAQSKAIATPGPASAATLTEATEHYARGLAELFGKRRAKDWTQKDTVSPAMSAGIDAIKSLGAEAAMAAGVTLVSGNPWLGAGAAAMTAMVKDRTRNWIRRRYVWKQPAFKEKIAVDTALFNAYGGRALSLTTLDPTRTAPLLEGLERRYD